MTPKKTNATASRGKLVAKLFPGSSSWLYLDLPLVSVVFAKVQLPVMIPDTSLQFSPVNKATTSSFLRIQQT